MSPAVTNPTEMYCNLRIEGSRSHSEFGARNHSLVWVVRHAPPLRRRVARVGHEGQQRALHAPRLLGCSPALMYICLSPANRPCRRPLLLNKVRRGEEGRGSVAVHGEARVGRLRERLEAGVDREAHAVP